MRLRRLATIDTSNGMKQPSRPTVTRSLVWAGILIVTTTVLFLTPRLLRRAQMDGPWCQSAIDSAQPVIAHLERIRQLNGAYPPELDPAIAPGNDWFYLRLSEKNYELGVTTKHWVSSFDVLILRAGEVYPTEWEQYRPIEIRGWRYIVGGNDLFRNERRAVNRIRR